MHIVAAELRCRSTLQPACPMLVTRAKKEKVCIKILLIARNAFLALSESQGVQTNSLSPCTLLADPTGPGDRHASIRCSSFDYNNRVR
jgi:hypothetical protein